MDQHNLEWKADDPVRLAHNLRQAMHAARFYPAYQNFGRLRPHIKFHVKKPDTVIGRWVDLELLNTALEDERDIVQEITVKTEVGLLEIIGAVMEQPNTLEQAFFPLASLRYDEKCKLYDWCKANDEELWFIIDHEEAGMTLTRRVIDMELEWKPEDVD